jgi:hypothetical protein
VPHFSENSIVYAIEDIIRDDNVFASALSRLMRGCRCAIIDSPFAATLENKGFTVDRVVGVGSIVCEPGCEGGEDGGYRLAAPAWGQGRVLKPGLDCVFYGSERLRGQLAALGFRVEARGFNELLDMVTREGKRGVAFLDEEADSLSVERLEGGCGVLKTTNPLHPAGAFGKPGLHACAEEIYGLQGPAARIASPVLHLSSRERVVVSRVEGLGNALIIHTDPESASRHIRVASWLGALYECGIASEYL